MDKKAIWLNSKNCVNYCSVQFSSVAHESQHARPPCPSPTPGVHSDSRPSSPWHHPAISSSVVPFSSCPQSLPVSESFPMSQLFAWGGQLITPPWDSFQSLAFIRLCRVSLLITFSEDSEDICFNTSPPLAPMKFYLSGGWTRLIGLLPTAWFLKFLTLLIS